MKDLDKILEILEKTDVEQRTTKELIEYGLNNYYIKKAIKLGRLEKIKKGTYKLTKVEKEKANQRTFNSFRKSVFKNDFEQAYEALYKTYQNKTTKKYDHHQKLYFILLQEILKEKKNFDFLDDIMIFSEQNYNNQTYYKHFIDFYTAILTHDFEQAYFSISRFKEIQKEEYGYNTTSAKLFFHLTSYIYHNKRKEEEKTASHQRNKKLYQKYYNNFKKCIKANNFENALENLKKARKYSIKLTSTDIKHFINILTTYLELEKSDKTLEDQEIDYSSLKNNYQNILYAALKNKDYKTAFLSVDKCIQTNTLKIYSKLLNILIEKNRENKKKKAQKDQIEKKELTLDEIEHLIFQKDYEKVEKLLEEYLQENFKTTYFKIFSLVKGLRKIENTNITNLPQQHIYENHLSSIFKRLIEAINFNDFQEIIKLIPLCEEAVAKNDITEQKLRIYKYLLKAIKENALLKRLDEEEIIFQQQLNDLINSGYLTKEKIEILKTLIEAHLKTCKEENRIYSIYLLEMLDTLENIEKLNLTKSNFERFSYEDEEKDEIKSFLKALSLGDYQTAFEKSHTKNWKKEVNNNPQKSYFIIYRELLTKISQNIPKKRKIPIPITTRNNNQTNEDSLLNRLNTLKEMLEKERFSDAFKFYQENDFTNLSPAVKKDIEFLLKYLENIKKKTAVELTQKFIYYEQRGDFKEAEKYLQELEELEKKDPYRDISYYRSHLEMLKKYINSKNFVKKEQLYDAARFFLYKRNNPEKAIELLNEYIKIDNDQNNKGYILRGIIHENNGQLKKAKEDYEKALSILKEPNGYNLLGNYYFHNRKYKKALEYLLKYEERRPKTSLRNLFELSTTYNKLKDKENSEKYKKLALAKRNKYSQKSSK